MHPGDERRLAWQRFLQALLVVLWIWAAPVPAAAQQPLPSWNDGPAKTAIMDCVRRVTQQGSRDFVPAAERIAAFDNDGAIRASTDRTRRSSISRCSS